MVEFMGSAEYVVGGEAKSAKRDMVWIWWRTPEEWAGMLEGWVCLRGGKMRRGRRSVSR